MTLLSSNPTNHTNTTTSYVMPAEWSRHAACLILYPHSTATYPGRRLRQAQAQVRAVARAIATHGDEEVIFLCRTNHHHDDNNDNNHNDDDDTERERLVEEMRRMMIMLPPEQEHQNGPPEQEHQNGPPSPPPPRRIHCLVCPSNDTWARDTAPTFVWQTNQKEGDDNNNDNTTVLVGLDWDFNAYGGPIEGCYWPCEADQQIAKTVCQLLSTWSLSSNSSSTLSSLPIPSISVPLVLEGGSIHTNGHGTMLTTQECLLHPNRNPHLTQAQIETIVGTFTGCPHWIWLPHGLHGDDDTNGHIDNWACFVQANQVVLAWTDDEQHDAENYHRCRTACRILQASTTHDGTPLIVHKLYLPSPPLYYTKQDEEEEEDDDNYDDDDDDDDDDNNNKNIGDGGEAATTTTTTTTTTAVPRHVGQRLAASYINFYIANAAVIVPQFGGTAADTDAQALETLQTLFADRTVVGVDSRAILWGGGNIHCITQQVPAREGCNQHEPAK